MAMLPHFHTLLPSKSVQSSAIPASSFLFGVSTRPPLAVPNLNVSNEKKKKRALTVVAAAGDVSSDSITYLFVGAALVALVGTAFPVFFSRKDLCPECDGAGFVRQSGAALRVNAARKDQAQIVCARCNGLGKLNQIDK